MHVRPPRSCDGCVVWLSPQHTVGMMHSTHPVTAFAGMGSLPGDQCILEKQHGACLDHRVPHCCMAIMPNPPTVPYVTHLIAAHA